MKWLNDVQSQIKTKSDEEASTINEEFLKMAIGILAFALPATMIISAGLSDDCNTVQPSISAYYHTGARDLFVGILCAVGVAMFGYKGYSKYDNFFATLASIAAIVVALCPTSVSNPLGDCIENVIDTGWQNVVHLTAAATLFIVLAIFCVLLFTITDPNPTRKRLKRNMIYYSCGFIIIASLIFIAISMNVDGFPQKILGFPVVFIFEAIALVAFSVSWFTKSKIIYSRW